MSQSPEPAHWCFVDDDRKAIKCLCCRGVDHTEDEFDVPRDGHEMHSDVAANTHDWQDVADAIIAADDDGS